MPIILALESLRQENLTFEASLGLYSEVLEEGDGMKIVLFLVRTSQSPFQAGFEKCGVATVLVTAATAVGPEINTHSFYCFVPLANPD